MRLSDDSLPSLHAAVLEGHILPDQLDSLADLRLTACLASPVGCPTPECPPHRCLP